MTLTEKKRKAAVIAVSCYTQMQTSTTNDAPSGVWGKMGISRIISGREALQRKGKTPGVKPFL